MKTYHGTKKAYADKIVGTPNNNVNVDFGRGELGKGFYTGESASIAASWAVNRYLHEDPCVLEFDKDQSEIIKLTVTHIKTREAVKNLHDSLKLSNTTHEHLFGTDYVVAPFESIDSALQYKFESKKAEGVLNKSTIKIFPCT